MKEYERFQRTHDVKQMAFLLEQLANDSDFGRNGISQRKGSIVVNPEIKRNLPLNSTVQRNNVSLSRARARQNSFVKFKESASNDLFITKSHESYFEERAARLNKRVSFSFQIQSDDGDVWSSSYNQEGDLNDDKRSRVTRPLKPLQSFDESKEPLSLQNKKSKAVKPLKRKISFTSFVKNLRKDRSRCTVEVTSDAMTDNDVPEKNYYRRDSLLNLIQNKTESPSPPAPRNGFLIRRDFEGEDSESSFTTLKSKYTEPDHKSSSNRGILIQPKSRRPPLTQIFDCSPHPEQLSTFSSSGRVIANPYPLTKSDSGYSSTTTTVSNQSLPSPSPENHPFTGHRPSISKTTATFKRQLSEISTADIIEDCTDPLQNIVGTSKEKASTFKQPCSVDSPKMRDKLKKKESKSKSLMRRFSQNFLGHIARKPPKSAETASTRFIGVNKYRAFENLVSYTEIAS